MEHIPVMRIDIRGPHVQEAVRQAEAVLANPMANPLEQLLAQNFLMALQAGMIHLGTLRFFMLRSRDMMEWPCVLPNGELVQDVWAPFTASAADRYPADVYGEGGEFPAIAAKYLIN